jgi:hypothetical protein
MKQIDKTGMHKQEVVRNHTVNTEMIKNSSHLANQNEH